jgi:hypothetical protein
MTYLWQLVQRTPVQKTERFAVVKFLRLTRRQFDSFVATRGQEAVVNKSVALLPRLACLSFGQKWLPHAFNHCIAPPNHCRLCLVGLQEAWIMAEAASPTVVVYDPPREGLPWLVAFIYPNGQVAGATAKSAEAAKRLIQSLPVNVITDETDETAH